MERADLPTYAIFEDYRSSQQVAVVVRWFVLVTWLVLINYNGDEAALPALNAMGGVLIGLNAYVHWRILIGRPITWPYVLVLSLMDLSVITAGIMMTSRFENTFFIFYYPALLGVALIFRRRVSFAMVAVVAAVYAGMSVTMEPGLDTSVLFDGDENRLTLRLISMFAIVVAANLMTRLERERRREAVSAERERLEENVRLQRRAEDAEREVQRERIRISQELHDGAAQSAYVISLGLETCIRVAGNDESQLRERLEALHAQSRQALWELRYPINLGPLFEGKGLGQILDEHISNFRTITALPTTLAVRGHEGSLPAVARQRLFSVAHNALTNAYKYAEASNITVELAYTDEGLELCISDDGVGMAEAGASSGHGLRNMRSAAQELGGSIDITSQPGQGTMIRLAAPVKEM